MTISPPSKVNLNHRISLDILASGIDSLYLAIDVKWETGHFFEYLNQMKEFARAFDEDCSISLDIANNPKEWQCLLKPHGVKGYEWLLTGSDFTLQIGNWFEPKSRPSIMAQVHSEALWRLGPLGCVNLLVELISSQTGKITVIKPSRVDLCLDVLFPEDLWQMDLISYRVTRAQYAAPHFQNANLTGISIGKGKIAARLYDKPLEINKKSKKFWMYQIWGIEEVPEGYKIIRIEFQLRREALKDLGLDTFLDLLDHIDKLWAYCSQNWLKFQDNPFQHHTLRNTFLWWQQIQDSFLGIQNPEPLIRVHAINTKKRQLLAQTLGMLSGLQALEIQESATEKPHDITIENSLRLAKELAEEADKSDFEFEIEVETKMAKYNRALAKMQEASFKRRELGHPDNNDHLIKDIIKEGKEGEWNDHIYRTFAQIKKNKRSREWKSFLRLKSLAKK